MDNTAATRAKARMGVVAGTDLGDHPGRSAVRAGLVIVQRGAYLAATQPDSVPVQLAALQLTQGERTWAVLEWGALWLHGAAALPQSLVVGVAHGQRLAVRPPLRRRRVSPAVMEGVRRLSGVPVVALEMAAVQCAARQAQDDVVRLAEDLLRARRTTVTRLRARCRRGVHGSAAMRAACDELSGGSLDQAVRRLHAALERRGVKDLEVEARFVNAQGASAYADLRHRPSRTSFEVDGFLVHSERHRFTVDRRRDRWLLREHGEAVVRVAADEVRDNLEALADELVELISSRLGGARSSTA